MTSELALKHKDSLTLKEDDEPHGEKRQMRKYVFKEKTKWKELSFPWLITIAFMFYCFIVLLLWLICYLTKRLPWSYWPFWTVVFIVWVVITCGIIVFWKRLEIKRYREVMLKYGSDHTEKPYSNVRQMTSESREIIEMKKMNIAHDEESKRNNRNLPPLTIHKRISGENENNEVKQDEKDETAQGSDIAEECKDRSFRDNLNLATASFSENGVKTPMSPRELFFIDLIREAEKAENLKSPNFCLSEMTENDAKDMKDVREDAQDTTDVKHENDDGKTSELKCRSSYFIANVESSADEKTEVFLQINSSVREQTGLSAEKPALTLKSNDESSQETSPSQAH